MNPLGGSKKQPATALILDPTTEPALVNLVLAFVRGNDGTAYLEKKNIGLFLSHLDCTRRDQLGYVSDNHK